MNFLAHFYLSPPQELMFLGNYLGDYVKGRLENLHEEFPAEVLLGIQMHRAIDFRVDHHDEFHALRSCLSPQNRRLSGVVIDLLYDYQLSINWEQYASIPLPTFIEESYQKLEQTQQWMPQDARRAFTLMKTNDWLTSYGSSDGIREILRQMKERYPVLDGAELCLEELLTLEKEVKHSFFLVMKDLKALVSEMSPPISERG